jgi:hypothetical protein
MSSTLSKFVTLEGSTNGFDRTIRLLTYLIKLFVYYYEKQYAKSNVLWISLDNIQKIIGDIRSSMRLPGTFQAIRNLNNLDEPDEFLRKLKIFQCVVMVSRDVI